MKTFITIILAVILLGGIYLFVVSQNQKEVINSLPKAEVSEENTEAQENTQSSDAIVMTKTSTGTTQEGSDSYEIDTENTFLRFTGYKVGGEHVGEFEIMRAEVDIEEGAIAGGRLTIDVTSVKTDSDQVDKHLQSEDFFDANTYPEISFSSTGIMFDDENQSAIIKGSLTFHGVTKEISAPLTVLANGIATDFTISMKEFGIEFPTVNDEVRIESQIVLK